MRGVLWRASVPSDQPAANTSALSKAHHVLATRLKTPIAKAMLARPNPVLGIAFMVSATLFIAATMLLAKALGTNALGDPLHPLQVAHGRFLFAFMVLAALAASLRTPIKTRNLKLHTLRSAFGFGGVTLMFAAAAYIPLSDATAISFLNPVFAMLLAIPVLGKRVGPWRWLAAGIALCGALILLRPGMGSFAPAALLALGAAMLFAVEVTVIKLLSSREAPVQLLLINNTIGLTLSTLAVLPVWQPPTPAQWAALAALGGLMAAAQGCYVNALVRADASLVVPFSYATLIFVTLYDLAIFATIPDAISILGAGVIVAGAALLAWREARNAHQAARRG